MHYRGAKAQVLKDHINSGNLVTQKIFFNVCLNSSPKFCV